MSSQHPLKQVLSLWKAFGGSRTAIVTAIHSGFFFFFTWEQLKAFLIYSPAVVWHLIFKASVSDTARGVRKWWEAQVTDAGLECYLQWSLSLFNAQQAKGLTFEGEEMKVSNCVLFELQWSSTTKQLSRLSHLPHLFQAYLFWRTVYPLKT